MSAHWIFCDVLIQNIVLKKNSVIVYLFVVAHTKIGTIRFFENITQTVCDKKYTKTRLIWCVDGTSNIQMDFYGEYRFPPFEEKTIHFDDFFFSILEFIFILPNKNDYEKSSIRIVNKYETMSLEKITTINDRLYEEKKNWTITK